MTQVPTQAREIERIYSYVDADGVPIYETVRFRPKGFQQRTPGGTWNMIGVERVPFNLPLLIAKKIEVTTFVVEGEKDAESLHERRLLATTNAGGAAWKYTDQFVEYFRGAKRVVFLPDCDEPGRKAAVNRAKRLVEVCDDVRIVDLAPDRGDGFDVSDWFDGGGSEDQLRVLVEAAPKFEAASASSEWAPIDALDYIPAPEPLPLALVPKPYQDYVEDVSERMCVPVEFVALPLMISTAAVLGRKIIIKPEEHNPWTEVPNLWGAIVAEPGLLKSAAQAAALAPLRRLQDARRRAFEAQSAELKQRQHVAQLKLEALGITYKQAIKAHRDTAEIEAEMQVHRAVLGERVSDRRCYVNDATVEKLGELLRDNPQGLLQVRDELAGFLRSMDRKGREADRAFYLEGWNGHGSFTVDRIGRGTIHIPDLCLLNFGGIQPGPLRDIVADAVRGGSGADGLVQRFSLLAVCITPPPFKKCNRIEDSAPRERVEAILDSLDSITFDEAGGSHVMGLDNDAQSVFDEWRASLEQRIRSDSESPAFRAWLSKQRKAVPALALLFHLVTDPERLSHPIATASVLSACAWSEILETHARHIYGEAIATPAMLLASKIKCGDLTDSTTLRELKRRKWSGLTSGSDVDAAIDELTAQGWLRVDSRGTGGRPSEIIRLHPTLRSNCYA